VAKLSTSAEGASSYARAFAPLVVYALSFFAVWSGYVIFVTPRFGGGPASLTLESSVKLSVWTLPVFLLVRLKERQSALDYLRLRSGWRKGLLYGLGLGSLLSLYLVAASLPDGFHFDPGFAWGKWVSGVLLIGFTEEIVFRGYFLQRLGARLAFRWANLTTALLFVLIHVPRWIRDGRAIGLGLLASLLYLIAFSVLLGWILKRSDSLWACMLAHAINNFTSFALGQAGSARLALALAV
jgi:membrane protease YdiL (CAAX protease family)